MLIGGIDATSEAYELIRQEFRGPNVMVPANVFQSCNSTSRRQRAIYRHKRPINSRFDGV